MCWLARRLAPASDVRARAAMLGTVRAKAGAWVGVAVLSILDSCGACGVSMESMLGIARQRRDNGTRRSVTLCEWSMSGAFQHGTPQAVLTGIKADAARVARLLSPCKGCFRHAAPMYPTLTHRNLLANEQMSPRELNAVLINAR